MRSQQSKLQNRSTSSSDFFTKKYLSSLNPKSQPFDQGIPYQLPSELAQHPSSIIQKSSKIIQQPSKLANEYQIYQNSKWANQNESQLQSSGKEQSWVQTNPFVTRNYDWMRKINKEGKSENNFSKNTFGSSYKQVKFECDRISTMKSEYQSFSRKQALPKGAQQFTHKTKSHSSHKQNIQPFTPNALTSTPKQTYNSQLLHPVTLIRASSHQNLIPELADSRFQQTLMFNEPHKILDHIYFTIAHQSDITNVFKQFAAYQQHKIAQRFKEIQMSLENTLNLIKITFDQQIHQTYQTLLSHLDSLHSMAQLMWKNKKSKVFSFHQLDNIPKIKRQQRIPSKSREKSKSKHTYLKFSQFEMRSTDSNSVLLKQLLQEDKLIGEYKMTKRFYNNESECGDEVNRDSLLRDMYQVSRSIGKIMKQCENGLLEQVLVDKRDKTRGQVWLREASKQKYFPGQEKKGYGRDLERIGEIISMELQELDGLVEGLKQSLRYKYKVV